MAATVLDLLETLETRFEQTRAALNALREENEMLKRRLANQEPQTQPPSQPLQDRLSLIHLLLSRRQQM